MNYKEQQRKKAIRLRDEVFRDPGCGQFQNLDREFVLKDPALNIWAGVRDDVINYFKRNNIQFWDTKNEPTGHLLSSQIACLNHLYFVRQRRDIATAILQGIDKKVRNALIMNNGSDSGYVDFEIIGAKNYLGEKIHTRGANSTSVDAMMLAGLDNGLRKLYFIEWKYVESYPKTSKAEGDSGKTRIKTYTPLLAQSDCPINVTDVEGLFTEPYYQLMRQTLLAHEMIKAKEYGADLYFHIHVIPKDNKELKDTNTAEGKLIGKTLEETWKNVLKSPDLYKAIDPKDFLDPARACIDCIAPLTYLEQRYWK
ncbi:MAG: hypothetical protein NT175_06960 [Bacteroidetes bacterium]|nr:hypothetical protein [Bacteroidota bacterium]